MSNLRQAHVQSYYRPMIAIFASVVVLMIGGVMYAGWSHATITMVASQPSVSTTLVATVGPSDTNDGDIITGTVKTEEQQAQVTARPTGTGTPTPAHATGSVQLVNTTAKAQPLAAGTRLQSTSGVIVRTTARVDVPAGGTVNATAIADPLGEEGQIPAGRLIIVALWPGLQDKIYGESTTDFTGGLVSSGSTLGMEELTAASDQAEQQIRNDVGQSRPGLFITLEPVSVVSNPKVSVPSAEYTVTVTMKVTTISYDTVALERRIRTELTASLHQGMAITELVEPRISLEDRPNSDQAILSIQASGTAHIASTHPYLSPTTYLGLSAQDIRTKLNDPELVTNVRVTMSPFWRTVAPDQPDRISVELQNNTAR